MQKVDINQNISMHNALSVINMLPHFQKYIAYNFTIGKNTLLLEQLGLHSG